ncbi:MAG: hypothetical protein ABI430_03090 [Candidatus Taylorbacteria bacterium]
MRNYRFRLVLATVFASFFFLSVFTLLRIALPSWLSILVSSSIAAVTVLLCATQLLGGSKSWWALRAKTVYRVCSRSDTIHDDILCTFLSVRSEGDERKEPKYVKFEQKLPDEIQVGSYFIIFDRRREGVALVVRDSRKPYALFSSELGRRGHATSRSSV